MTFRAAWLWIVLVGIAGCDDWIPKYPYRVPCEEDADLEACCPSGSHEVRSSFIPEWVVCAPDEVPCADAGADAGACPEAGTDAP